MKKKGFLIAFGTILSAICIWFIYMNGYVGGKHFFINESGEIISQKKGFDKYEGMLVTEGTPFWIFSSHNRFDASSRFYKKRIYIVNNEGKVVLEDKEGLDGIIVENSIWNLLTYKGKYIILNSDGEIEYIVPDDKKIVDGENFFGILPFYYNDESNDESRTLYGYVNLQDEVVVEPQFIEATSFTQEGLARVTSIDGKSGFINLQGEFVIPPIYKLATVFNDGIAGVITEDSVELNIDTEGNIMPYEGSYSYIFSEGYAAVEGDNGKYAFMDKEGNMITDYLFDKLSTFNNGYAVVCMDGQYVVINTEGEIVLETQLMNMKSFSDNGLASAQNEEGLWGYVNIKGEWIIEPKYSYGYSFRNGTALVEMDNK